MPRRRSEAVYDDLTRLSDRDKAQAILLVAARNGKSQKDLVEIIVGFTKIKTRDQALEVAKVWAPLLKLKPDRFAELAADFF